MLQFVRIQSQKGFVQVKSYQRTPRHLLNITYEEHPHLSDGNLIRRAVRVIKTTIGPDGLVSSLLPLGVLPSFPCPNSQFPTTIDLMHLKQKESKWKPS